MFHLSRFFSLNRPWQTLSALLLLLQCETVFSQPNGGTQCRQLDFGSNSSSNFFNDLTSYTLVSLNQAIVNVAIATCDGDQEFDYWCPVATPWTLAGTTWMKLTAEIEYRPFKGNLGKPNCNIRCGSATELCSMDWAPANNCDDESDENLDFPMDGCTSSSTDVITISLPASFAGTVNFSADMCDEENWKVEVNNGGSNGGGPLHTKVKEKPMNCGRSIVTLKPCFECLTGSCVKRCRWYQRVETYNVDIYKFVKVFLGATQLFYAPCSGTNGGPQTTASVTVKEWRDNNFCHRWDFDPDKCDKDDDYPPEDDNYPPEDDNYPPEGDDFPPPPQVDDDSPSQVISDPPSGGLGGFFSPPIPPPPPSPVPVDPEKPPFPYLKDDPHIVTWKGFKYDYPGLCDIVLLSNPIFRNGIGMEIHGRTAPWSGPKRPGKSGTKNMAIRIGTDILEFQAPLSDIKYWFNGNEGSVDSDTGNVSGEPLPEFMGNGTVPLTHTRFNNVRYHFNFHLDDDARSHITIEVHNDFMNLFIHNGKKEDFEFSLGMFGRYSDGVLSGRDPFNVIKDPLLLGQEWQVGENDWVLFHEPSAQASGMCEVASGAITE